MFLFTKLRKVKQFLRINIPLRNSILVYLTVTEILQYCNSEFVPRYFTLEEKTSGILVAFANLIVIEKITAIYQRQNLLEIL